MVERLKPPTPSVPERRLVPPTKPPIKRPPADGASHYSDIDRRILYHIRDAANTGAHGLTADEVSVRLDMDARSIAPRMHRLEHETKDIVDSGIKRKTRLGSLARVMAPCDAEPSLGL